MELKNLKLIIPIVLVLLTAFCQAKDVRHRKPIRPIHRKMPVIKRPVHRKTPVIKRPIHHKAPVVKRFVRPPVGSRRIIVGGISYWIHAGIYYRHDVNDYFIVTAPVIKILPKHHKVIIVSGRVYYVADDVYYKSGLGGYIVVEKPRSNSVWYLVLDKEKAKPLTGFDKPPTSAKEVLDEFAKEYGEDNVAQFMAQGYSLVGA